MRFPWLRLLAVPACAAGLLRAASFEARVETLFRPPLGERLALSPDGQRVAYTTLVGRELAIVITSVDNADRKRTIVVEPDHEAAGAEEKPPGQLRFLRWATADRLIYAPTERIVPLPPITDKDGRTQPNPDGPTILAPIMAVNADGRQWGTVVDARDFQETPAAARHSLADLLRTPAELQAANGEPVRWRMPHLNVLGFLPRDREQLIVETRGAYSMPIQHLVDLRTGGVREFGDDWAAPPGEPEIFDWFRLKVVGERRDGLRPSTLWRDDDLARVQRELEVKFPRRIVEVLDWSDTHARVLVRVTGGTDPGRVFVWQRPEDLVVEILQCAPWLSAAKLNPTRWFECNTPDGARLSGYLTWPGTPPHGPPPLLVIFPAANSGGAQPAFDPEAQVFADLGFAVARLNHRSAGGADAAARRDGNDRVSIDDARTAIEAMAAQNPARAFDRKRVAVLGRNFGGYLAGRALQWQPTVFRSAIAIGTPDDLRAQLNGVAGAADFLELAREWDDSTTKSRVSVYRKIEEFLNQHLPSYAVKIGATKEVP